jgi:3-deoxy-D-manno-octulosonate 8-phosphate phosphatase (KDO 8-P phosphatase)
MDKIPDFTGIKAFVLDVDGVLTDGSILAMENGDQVRVMNLKGLGIAHVYMGAGEKLPVFRQFLEVTGLKSEQVIYIGDDMPDLPVMEMAGIGIAPADAAEDVRRNADLVTQKAGGKGCVREVIEAVMKHQGKWYASDSFIW